MGIDPVSQDPEALRALSDHHDMPVLAIHAPCLLFTQRVWGDRAVGQAASGPREMAEARRAPTWSSCTRRSAGSASTPRGFVEGIAALQSETDVAFAVENMYPWRARSREVAVYLPGWDPLERGLRQRRPSTSRTPRSSRVRRGRDGRAARRPAAPRPPHRRRPARPRTSTSSPAAAPSRAPRCSSGWPGDGFDGTRRARDQHPARGQPRRARGRPRRGPGVRPAQPRSGRRGQPVTGRQLFDRVASDYDAYRPDYPAQLFDALESAMGQPLLRADVSTSAPAPASRREPWPVAARRSSAVDPGPRRAVACCAPVDLAGASRRRRRQRAAAARRPLRPGDATRSRFHWTDPDLAMRRGVPGAARPGGVLAIWWNRHDLSVAWFARHQRTAVRRLRLDGS